MKKSLRAFALQGFFVFMAVLPDVQLDECHWCGSGA